MGKAILVVSFGTTYPETREKTIGACEQTISEHYPDFEIYRAFTSNVVIRRIKNQEGIIVHTVKESLEQMLRDGVKEVYIQPLHIIIGHEFDKIMFQIEDFEEKFDVLKVAKPLLSSEKDYLEVQEILLRHYGHFADDAACVMMGHGSQHYAFTAYAALDHMLLESSVHIGCVESYPPVESIEERVKQLGVKEIHLAPFMLVAGDHACNDMISDDEDSWKTFFSNKGYQVIPHLKGMGEFPEIQAMYVHHLSQIID